MLFRSMLDEPAGGLTHSEVDELAGVIRNLRDDLGLTVLLVEHHMAMVMAISDHIVVLDFGSKIADGPPAEITRQARACGSSAAHGPRAGTGRSFPVPP